MRIISRIALVLVIIGAINWGLIGFFKYDLVSSIFGGETAGLSRIIFGLVGLSGLLCLPLLFDPVGDVDVVTDRDHKSYRNPNLGTELGEEPDFTDIKDVSKKDYDKD
ncbi:DUF378 domain-containing protein [Psychrobacillus glaciei]|uniref:DUF378 domain-containing protein n=1 Tax=Psychrobacillus glaciei TaxID=2283160 RepID=A0A5J6SSZ9_9BACI|nr:DUF378 domain-containing protein [Psychrobacillus glaciei]QFG00025.1 DUF378 domain-containing protein [Psychrobacillus glaciei]